MPHVRKYKRKTYRKKRPSTRVPKPTNTYRKIKGPFRSFVSADPFRPQMSVKLRFTDTTVLTSGLNGAIGDLIKFRLNSLFDPDFSAGIGQHQPYGYDQLATLYQRYKVTGALVEVVFTDPDQDGMTLAVQMQSHNNIYDMAGKTTEELRMQPMTVVRTVSNSGKQRVAIRQFMPISTVSMITKLQFQADNDIYTAFINANPAIVPRVHIGVGSSRVVQGASIVCRTTITYYATMYDRYIQAAST